MKNVLCKRNFLLEINSLNILNILIFKLNIKFWLKFKFSDFIFKFTKKNLNFLNLCHFLVIFFQISPGININFIKLNCNKIIIIKLDNLLFIS